MNPKIVAYFANLATTLSFEQKSNNLAAFSLILLTGFFWTFIGVTFLSPPNSSAKFGLKEEPASLRSSFVCVGTVFFNLDATLSSSTTVALLSTFLIPSLSPLLAEFISAPNSLLLSPHPFSFQLDIK